MAQEINKTPQMSMSVEQEHQRVGSMSWDYIFVGGGLSASVVSSRLIGLDPTLNILVVEAGRNANNDPDIIYPNSTNLMGGTYDWKYVTAQQAHLGGRNVSVPCGKGLGGGTVINAGMSARMCHFISSHLLTKE